MNSAHSGGNSEIRTGHLLLMRVLNTINVFAHISDLSLV